MGVEVVVLGIFLFHFVEVSGQVVFATQVEHPRKMVYFLVCLHFSQSLGRNCVVSPGEVPVSSAVAGGTHFERLDNLFEDWVFAI